MCTYLKVHFELIRDEWQVSPTLQFLKCGNLISISVFIKKYPLYNSIYYSLLDSHFLFNFAKLLIITFSVMFPASENYLSFKFPTMSLKNGYSRATV